MTGFQPVIFIDWQNQQREVLPLQRFSICHLEQSALGRSFGRFERKVSILIEESSKTGERYWLHSIVDPEQLEGALLQGRGSGNEVERHGVAGSGQQAVFGYGRQVT